MRKFLLCLFVNLLVHNVVQSQITKCSIGDECLHYEECEEITNKTSNGQLTDQQKEYLKSRQCRSIDGKFSVCCKIEETKLPKAPVCGRYSISRLLNDGDIALLKEHPWTTQIQYSKPGNELGIHCEGTLIHERYVLTAASCVQKVPNSWKITQVRLGDWNTETNPDCQGYIEPYCVNPYVEIPVAQVIVHENYDHTSENQHNDIALLKLQQNVQFTYFVKPICIRVTNYRYKNFSGRLLEFSGFLKPDKGTFEKNKLFLNEIPLEKCQDSYSNQNVTLSNSQICAVGIHRDNNCHLYNGGALMRFIYKIRAPHFVLVGIFSYKPLNCSEQNVPGVYTRVSEYVDWIEKNID